MRRNEQGAYKNMANENGVYSTTCTVLYCTTSIIPNNLHRNSNLLNFHPALYSLTQKAGIHNMCRIVRIFLTENE